MPAKKTSLTDRQLEILIALDMVRIEKETGDQYASLLRHLYPHGYTDQQRSGVTNTLKRLRFRGLVGRSSWGAWYITGNGRSVLGNLFTA